MMKFVFLTFAFLLAFSKDTEGLRARDDADSYCYDCPSECRFWKKLNNEPVCFEGRNDKPGEFTSYRCGTMVTAMKLVYRSGKIRCANEEKYDSRWGCSYEFPNQDMKDNPLNVIVTDEKNHKIYPQDKYIAQGWTKPGLWYYLPGANSVTSNELVFADYGDPFYLSSGMKLKIWYGEDLKNWYDADDVGKVCVDVYIHGDK